MNTKEHKPDVKPAEGLQSPPAGAPAKAKHRKVARGRIAMQARHMIFVRTFLTNGRNATRAAIAAGYGPADAAHRGLDLLKRPEIAKFIAKDMANLEKITGLAAERTLREVARIAYSDPRQLFTANGKPIPIEELGDDQAATVASSETDVITKHSKIIGRTTKLKLWDKNAALEKAMRFHGLYERDNAQRGESLKLQVVLVGPK